MNIQNKNITILGAERSGFAVARLAKSQGSNVRISDQKAEFLWSSEILNWCCANDVQVQSDAHTKEFICDQTDMVVVSPGVPISAAPVQWAKEKNILVLGEIEFAFQFCQKPIIVITGSNGKTTVSTLTHLTLERAGFESVLCGNIGTPLSSVVDRLDKVDYVVIEVSSFQLESLLDDSFQTKFSVQRFSPHIAIILNIRPNHLDRHRDMDEYAKAKWKIFQNQKQTDYAFGNSICPWSIELSSDLTGQWQAIDFLNSSNPNQTAVEEIVKTLGISTDIVEDVCRSFQGVEHRMEVLGKFNDVIWINDSKSTTPEAGEWALKRLASPIIMICGGRDKNVSFDWMQNLVANKVKQMYVLGESKEKIQKTFESVINVEVCQSLEESISKAHSLSKAMDTVLFSPMCTSFDMFQNFEDRGKQFKKLVEKVVK